MLELHCLTDHLTAYQRGSGTAAFNLGLLQTSLNMSPSSQNTVLPSQRRSPSNVLSNADDNPTTEEISPTDTRFGVVDEHARLFGKQLPDPIHLHTEIGTFDG